MSGSARIAPVPPRPPGRPGRAGEPQPPAQAGRSHPLGHAWFGWWVAFCLAVLAFNTWGQLDIQRRLLSGSQTLERMVGESRTVSAETNRQLAQVALLEQATRAMDGKLARVGAVNGAIKADLRTLEETAAAIDGSIATLVDQAGESRTLLDDIAAQSAALHATLADSRRVSEAVAGHLTQLVWLEEAVGADLAEMDRKTRILER